MSSKKKFNTANIANIANTANIANSTPLSDIMDMISDNDTNSNCDTDSNCDEFSKFISTLTINNTNKQQNKSNKRKKMSVTKSANSASFTKSASSVSSANLANSTNKKKLPIDAIIYARCSTARQNLDNFQSLSNQVVMCIDYCKDQNLNTINIIKEIHNGHNMSELKISEIPQTYSNINIIIADPSRMSRNVSDANDFIIQCNKKNIILHFVRDDLVLDSHKEYKKVIDLVCDAYHESQLMSKRLKTTFDMKKKHGSHIGSASYGFKINEIIDPKIHLKIRKLVPNKSEQDVIDIINRLYFGSDIKDFNKIFQRVSQNKKFVLKDTNNNAFDTIYYGNITYNDIADLLNENNILKRNIVWTSKSISNILSKTENFNIKYYDNLNDDNINDDNEMSCDDI